jgi:hypothetical protein
MALQLCSGDEQCCLGSTSAGGRVYWRDHICKGEVLGRKYFRCDLFRANGFGVGFVQNAPLVKDNLWPADVATGGIYPLGSQHGTFIVCMMCFDDWATAP